MSTEQLWHKQLIITASEHNAESIDIKERTTENTVLLLQRDNNQVEDARPKHNAFTNLKGK